MAIDDGRVPNDRPNGRGSAVPNTRRRTALRTQVLIQCRADTGSHKRTRMGSHMAEGHRHREPPLEEQVPAFAIAAGACSIETVVTAVVLPTVRSDCVARQSS